MNAIGRATASPHPKSRRRPEASGSTSVAAPNAADINARKGVARVRLLVTGGAGYIGSVVTLRLLQAGHDVTVLDDLSTGHEDAVPAGARFVRGDLTDATGVLADGEPYDGVLHFAAKAL